MNIIHRYIFSHLLRSLFLCLAVFVLLFLIFDFFDRIDNIVAEESNFSLTLQYFLFKVPLMAALMLPVSMMVAVLFTIGIMSKNSEIVAMRASGISVRMLAFPIVVLGLLVSISGFLLSEFVVPYTQRRAKDIYNLDIRKKDERGGYSQSNLWWRKGETFYSADTFDSRTNSIHGLSSFQVDSNFRVERRVNAKRTDWIDKLLGWSMRDVTQYRFETDGSIKSQELRMLPLPLEERPTDFYDVKTDPNTMSLFELRKFVQQQMQAGVSVLGYLPYLYEKVAFPLSSLIVGLVVFTFALRPARSGGMASSVLAALLIGFSYYAVHSFSVAMGKAEILPAFISAWIANALLGFVASVLILGAESPS